MIKNRRLRLTKGKYAVVDAQDFDWLNKWSWQVSECGKGYFYALRHEGKRIKGIRKMLLMHRVIMKARKGQIIDHINRKTLDNRRENLRFCTASQNTWNSMKKNKKSSMYKGVSKKRDREKWDSSIHINGKTKYLGSFDGEKQAALAYNKAARKYHGEFACLNTI